MTFRKKKDVFVSVLDLGSTKTAACLCRLRGGHQLELLGLGVAPSMGVRNGNVVDLEEASLAIRTAVEKAEKDSGARLGKSLVGINGRGLKSFNSRGSVSLGGSPLPITNAHVTKCVDAARNISLAGSQQPVHDVIRHCIVDDELEVDNPIGMVGTRLEVGLHIMTLPRTQAVHFTKAVNHAGIHVSRLVVQPLAGADSALKPEEKEFGSLLVEVGACATSGVVFQKGKIQHSFSIPVGGEHFTRDIVTGLRTTLKEAEHVKCESGVIESRTVEPDETLEIVGAGSGRSRRVARQVLAEILQPRSQEILEYIRGELRLAGYESAQMSSAVFCGGGAMLNQFVNFAENFLDIPCRLGHPAVPEGWPESLSTPAYAGLVGLVLRARIAQAQRDLPYADRLAGGEGILNKTSGRFRSWFQEFLSI